MKFVNVLLSPPAQVNAGEYDIHSPPDPYAVALVLDRATPQEIAAYHEAERAREEEARRLTRQGGRRVPEGTRPANAPSGLPVPPQPVTMEPPGPPPDPWRGPLGEK